MIEDLILEYANQFRRVRGWRPRRMYINTDEMCEAIKLSASRGTLIKPGPIMFCGCVLRHRQRPDVVAAIRAWDLS